MATATITEIKNLIIDRINTHHLPLVEEGEEFGTTEITEELTQSLNRSITQELTVDTHQMEELFDELSLNIDLAEWVASEPAEMIATHLDTQGATIILVTAHLSIDDNHTITYDPTQEFLDTFVNDWAERVADLNLHFTRGQEVVVTDWDSRDAYITSLLTK